MGKVNKATKRYISSGKLKKEIDQRNKHKKIKQQILRRRGAKGRRGDKNEPNPQAAETAEDADAVDGNDVEDDKFKGMSVDDFLGAAFMTEGGKVEGGDGDDNDDSSDDEGEDKVEVDDDESFASVDDLEDEEETHKMDLDRLKIADPEFYKYLQENDQELLAFGNEEEDAEMDEDVGEEDGPVDAEEEMQDDTEAPLRNEVTKDMLRRWQKSLLEHHSLRALRRMLLAFRAAAHMNEDDDSGEFAYAIDNAAVFNKLVVTALKYTPVVLAHHLPYKTFPDGRFKAPTQNKKYAALQKLIFSYFNNVLYLIRQLPDGDMRVMVVSESAKIIPYIVSSRKIVKDYTKLLFDLWSSATDDVRMASLLAIRRLASAPDQSILDICLKGIYVSLVRSSKSTTVYTLPSINLMKNSASEIYTIDHQASYQHAFRYIRQLAIHLRESMKAKDKESYKKVYNWQYIHSTDFWSIVLAKACDRDQLVESGEESPLQPLIYPLVQVMIGVIQLIPNPRYFPLHFHCLRSILHLSRHTGVYVPISPFILQILTSSELMHKPKPSTLRPIDLETFIRAPAPYSKTRVYQDALLEESAFLLTDWFGVMASSIAFPELSVPVTVLVRRTLKKSPGPKMASIYKPLVERLEEHAKWMENKRSSVTFGPGDLDQVKRFEGGIEVADSPLGKWLKVQRKARDKRKALLEKARDGAEEVLET